MVDSATLKVKTIRENLEDAKESVVFEDTYVKQQVLDSIPRGRIVKTFITTVDLATEQPNVPFSVTLSFFKITDWWKSGWLIEGAILEPAYPDEPEPQPYTSDNGVKQEEQKEEDSKPVVERVRKNRGVWRDPLLQRNRQQRDEGHE
jgi:hypothetical protein